MILGMPQELNLMEKRWFLRGRFILTTSSLNYLLVVFSLRNKRDSELLESEGAILAVKKYKLEGARYETRLTSYPFGGAK